MGLDENIYEAPESDDTNEEYKLNKWKKWSSSDNGLIKVYFNNHSS